MVCERFFVDGAATVRRRGLPSVCALSLRDRLLLLFGDGALRFGHPHLNNAEEAFRPFHDLLPIGILVLKSSVKLRLQTFLVIF